MGPRKRPSMVRNYYRKVSWDTAKRRFDQYTKIVEELPQMRGEAVQLVRQAVSEGRRAYVLVNNRVAGKAPLTVQAIRDHILQEEGRTDHE